MSDYTPQQITAAGADHVRMIAKYLSIEQLQAALEYARTDEFKATRRWSQTLVKTIKAEIRKKERAAANERKLRLIEKAYE